MVFVGYWGVWSRASAPRADTRDALNPHDPNDRLDRDGAQARNDPRCPVHPAGDGMEPADLDPRPFPPPLHRACLPSLNPNL